MIASLRVLLVEDSASDAKIVLQQLRTVAHRIECERVQTAEAMRAALDGRVWDIVISDWSMPKFSAPAALGLLRETQPDLPFIIVSGTIGEETAVEAMRAGAQDYVVKDKLARLTPAIERELRECKDRVARRQAEAALKDSEQRFQGLEEQLRQAQKMDAVGRLAGGVAHDFNNVLSVVLGYCELLLAGLKAGDPMRDDLEEVQKAAERAASLTRQLLLFSRHEAVEAKVIDLHDVVTGMDKMLRRILGEEVDLVLVASKSVSRVKVDPSHIEQVIVNLVVNARDATPTGGKVTIEIANAGPGGSDPLEFPPANPGPHVTLAVSDTGVGMDRDTQARIFEPFFTTKEKGKGTGLGLSTVFGIVKQSGGEIRVKSKPGHGTTFKVYLPRIDAELDAPMPKPVATATLRGTETILLVEDEQQLRTIVLTALKRQGYRVLVAQHPGEALLICERHPEAIDLLLTDVVMPHMSGPELAKRLLSARRGIKVLYMSGYTDENIAQHGVFETGMAFMQKPVTPSMLARKVRETLDTPSRHA